MKGKGLFNVLLIFLLIPSFFSSPLASASATSETAGKKEVRERRYSESNLKNKRGSRRRGIGGNGGIIVKYKTAADGASKVNDIASRHGLKLKRNLPGLNLQVLQAPEGTDPKAVIERLKQDDSIEYAEPDYEMTPDSIPNDPGFPQMWGLHNTGQTGGVAGEDISAPGAWDITTGSSEVIVAIIDSGVDYTHPDLAANMWRNPDEIPGDNKDNDGNGYIDDIYGINSGDHTGDPMDYGTQGHGTHCAGIIGAIGNNGLGIIGVCPNVKIMALRVNSRYGSGSVSNAIAAIYYAISKGAHIINNTWGFYNESQALSDVIQVAQNAGILFITSAGNDGDFLDDDPHYPASYDHDNIIAVAAIDDEGKLAGFSNRGKIAVDVGAPGVDIYSTIPNNQYSLKYGTSMAASHVTGIAALLKAFDPSLEWWQIKARILDNVVPTPGLKWLTLTKGRVNAHDALLDSQRPQVEITEPDYYDVVKGISPIQTSLSAAENVVRVEYYIDGNLIHTDTTAPWQCDWDTTAYTDGRHSVKVVAVDNLDRSGEAETEARVHNVPGPLVTFNNYSDGFTGCGLWGLSVRIDYSRSIDRIELYVDNVKVDEIAEPGGQCTFKWLSTGVSNGSHTLKAVAYASDGTTGEGFRYLNIQHFPIPESERNALIALYNSTGGDNWFSYYGWKTSEGDFNYRGTEYKWKGIRVENNHVVGITLDSNRLIGGLPPEIGDLTYLVELSLAHNSIDTFPTEMGNLTRLEKLRLSSNYFEGAIPPVIFNLTGLKELNLAFSDFSGALPPEIGNLTNLVRLNIPYCYQMSGPVPSQLFTLTKLEYLAIQSCGLSGSIPSAVGNLTGLKYLNMGTNSLSGPLPPELGNLSNLETLYLYETNFDGLLPPELGNCSALKILCISDGNLTGSIPATLANCLQLESLCLSNNKLSGPIPPEMGTFTQLRELDLGNNQFSGPIPSQLGNLVNTNFIMLNGNKLTGLIPPELANVNNGGWLSVGVYYNALYTDDPVMQNLLYDDEYNWEETQTVAPSGISTASKSNSGIRLTWTPIVYTYGDGGYGIYYATAPGGPYTLYTTTPDKSTSMVDVEGLSPNRNYYFKIQTVSLPNYYNKNTVESEFSAEVTGRTLSSSYISVLSPNGGEVWEAGSQQTIQWSASGIAGNVDICYSTSGVNGTYIPIATVPVDAGSYLWTLPNIDSQQNVIRISAQMIAMMDTGDNVFTIIPPPSLTLTSPNGGELWKKNRPQRFTWDHEKVTDYISLSLYKNDTYVQSIGGGLAENGVSVYRLPNSIPSGSGYKVRISEVSFDYPWTNGLIDFSDGTFTLLAAQDLGIDLPDFNDDGHPDLLLRHYAHGSNQVWYMDGLTKTGSVMLPSIPNLNWHFEGTADFNDDGFADILLRDYEYGSNQVWYMNGVTKTSSVMLPRIPDTEWRVDGIADFNNDDKPDLLLRNYSSGLNQVWFMDGVTKTGSVMLPRIPDTQWHIEAVADLSGDGKPDILLRHYQRGTNQIWIMDGITKLGSTYLPELPDTQWHIETAVDFDSDGKTDILFRNTETGANKIWLMHGTIKIKESFLPTIPDTAWKIEN